MDAESILDFEIFDSGFRELIQDVIARIPKKFEEDFPIFSIYERPCPFLAQVDEDTVIFDVDQILKIGKGNSHALIGLIAHELAHVYLRHAIEDDIGQDGLKEEGEADGLACEWGLSEEISSFRSTFGPPTPE